MDVTRRNLETDLDAAQEEGKADEVAPVQDSSFQENPVESQENPVKSKEGPDLSQSEKLLDDDIEIETNQSSENQAVSNTESTQDDGVDEAAPVQDKKPVDSEKEPEPS